MTASTILRAAADIVSGPRSVTHGPDREDFGKIAVMWSAYLTIRRSWPGPLTAEDVAHMMAGLKQARSQCGEHNPDDAVDHAGYAGIAGEFAEREAAK